MTCRALIALAFLASASPAAAQNGVVFLPRYDFHLGADHLSNADPRFVWDTNFGGDLDVVGDLTIKGITREVVLRVEQHGQAKDPWGNPYRYRCCPGQFGEYDLWSEGADGAPGGEGENADVTSWESAAK